MNGLELDNRSKGVGIVGAGLVGCLAALAFAQKGFSVTLFELRNDPKFESNKGSLRSINLAVSNRGISALRYVDKSMAERILEHVVPLKGRMIHDIEGNQESQVYGLFGECINSIDRTYLNEMLLEEIRHSDIRLEFNQKLVKIENLSSESDSTLMVFVDNSSNESEITRSYEFDYVVGADGAHSQFRHQLQRSMRMNVSQNYIDMQYMELYIPPNKDANATSAFSIDPNHLHIWPRHQFMLIALANEDGSFTSTFFSPWSVIESMKSATDFVNFFRENFSDAFNLIGKERLIETFDNNPRGSLLQVSAYPYHHPSGRAIVIGDAAHSMVPFYGQGMNCGFEDVRVLMQLIDSHSGDIESAFKAYSDSRADDLSAISKLAMDNYYEMSSKVVDPFYLIRKKLDYFLGRYVSGRFFQWLPMYTMISFRDDIPYSRAVEIEKRQKRILNKVQFSIIGGATIYVAFKAAQLWDKIKRS